MIFKTIFKPYKQDNFQKLLEADQQLGRLTLKLLRSSSCTAAIEVYTALTSSNH